MGFAENLKEIRHKRNITQEQLAELLSVSRQMMNLATSRPIPTATSEF